MAVNQGDINGSPDLETMSDFGLPKIKSPDGDSDNSKDTRQEASVLISKIKVMILAKVKNTNERQVISDNLDELYEMFVEQSVALAVANSKVDTLTLQIVDLNAPSNTTSNANSTFADAARQSEEHEGTQGSKRTPEKRGKTRAPGVVTDHVLLIYPKDKNTKSKSLDKRLTKAISPRDLKIQVKGKKPVSSGGLCVRLSKKEEVEILEKAIRENEELKDTVLCTVPKLRNPRVIVYDVPLDIEGTDVVQAAAEQAGVEVEHISIKFPIKGKDQRHWVLETTPEAFPPLKRLGKLVLGWSRSKISEHLRPTQCFRCGRYGHISRNCKNKEACLECGSTKQPKSKSCAEGRCRSFCGNCEHVNQFYQPSERTSLDHSPLHPMCPTRALEVVKLKKRINYG